MNMSEGKVNVSRMCKIALGMKPETRVSDMDTDQKRNFWAMSKIFEKGQPCYWRHGAANRAGKGMKLLEAFILANQPK